MRPVDKSSDKKQYNDNISRENFWDKHFKGRNYIKWSPEFEEAFLVDVDRALDNMIDEKDQKWLLIILKRELEVDSNGDRVVKENYDR